MPSKQLALALPATCHLHIMQRLPCRASCMDHGAEFPSCLHDQAPCLSLSAGSSFPPFCSGQAAADIPMLLSIPVLDTAIHPVSSPLLHATAREGMVLSFVLGWSHCCQALKIAIMCQCLFSKLTRRYRFQKELICCLFIKCYTIAKHLVITRAPPQVWVPEGARAHQARGL